MGDNKELKDDYDNASSTGESEYNSSYDIDVEEYQEDDDDSIDNHVLVLEIYCHHHIRNFWWGDVVKHFSDELQEYLSGCL